MGRRHNHIMYRKHIRHNGWHSYPKKKKTNKIIIGIIFILIVFFILSFLGNYFSKNETSSENGSFIDNIKSFFSKLATIPPSLNTCPQIDVSMSDGYFGLNIKNKIYDGWKIYGDATCKKGNTEGENLNYYYCGGYSNGLLGGTVNAYIQKTPISNDGSIGKTTKHVIWNIYDENKNFIQTKCLGDPDEYEEKQSRELRRSMESGEWFFGG